MPDMPLPYLDRQNKFQIPVDDTRTTLCYIIITPLDVSEGRCT